MDKLGEIPSLDILQRSLKNSPGCHWLVLRSAYLSPQKSREEKVTSLIPTLPVRRVPSTAWTSLDVAEPIQCLFI